MSLALNAICEAHTCGRWLIGGIVAILSFVALAESVDQLVVSPDYDDLLIDEIYRSADDWRKPPAFESEWRPEPQEPKSRIHFGVDSAYEEMQLRGYDRNLYSGMELETPRPYNQFRVEFNF